VTAAEHSAPNAPPRLRIEAAFAADSLGLRGSALGRLRGLDWSVDRGLHAVVGAPSDGSVALAMVLSGAVRPTSGRCLLDGTEPARSSSLRRRIGALEPAPSLAGGSVRQVARTVAALRGIDAGAALEPLEDLGLGPLLDRAPADLSFAELRGVELGLALAHPSPRIVVIYEPWSLVQGVTATAIHERLVTLARECCVVVVASTASDVASIADEVWFLDGGRWAEPRGGIARPGAGAQVLTLLVHDPEGNVVPSLVEAMSNRWPQALGMGWSSVGAADGGLRRIELHSADAAKAAILATELLAERAVDVRAIECRPPWVGAGLEPPLRSSPRGGA